MKFHIVNLTTHRIHAHRGTTVTGLLRQGHFLGSKLRTLRKRNGLTLEELSSRCVQLDAGSAPSVSYLSMVETGKRIPSTDTLAVLAAVFGKDPGWFLDRTESLASEPRGSRAGIADPCRSNPLSCFPRTCCNSRCRTARPDGHQRPAVCAPAGACLAGNPPERVSGHRACRRNGGPPTHAALA
jgi:transcriptional regulator with XRE-family HTH domain